MKNLVAKAFADASAEGADTFAIANAVSQEIGYVYANALAEVSGKVFVEGKGSATSFASSSAEAQAAIVAEAIAAAVSEATNGDTRAVTAVDASETKVAIAQAVANVDIRLTTTGGFAEGTSRAISNAVAKVTVTAIGDALAYNVGNESASDTMATATVDVDDRSKSTSDTNVQVGGQSTADAWSESNASVHSLEFCWQAKPCCNGHFQGENGKKCMYQNGGWTYQSTWVSGIQVWTEIQGGKSCRC